MRYSRHNKLDLVKRIGITQEVYDILRDEKRKSIKENKKISMAKLTCNIILEWYEQQQRKKE